MSEVSRQLQWRRKSKGEGDRFVTVRLSAEEHCRLVALADGRTLRDTILAAIENSYQQVLANKKFN
jgi:hypothetical protein